MIERNTTLYSILRFTDCEESSRYPNKTRHMQVDVYQKKLGWPLNGNLRRNK